MRARAGELRLRGLEQIVFVIVIDNSCHLKIYLKVWAPLQVVRSGGYTILLKNITCCFENKCPV